MAVVAAGLFVFLGMYLFFEETYDSFFGSEGTVGFVLMDEVVLVEPLPLQSSNPTVFDMFTRQRLNNIYEPLIRPDVDLNMKSALALNWGLLDDVTWEFNLRNDVKFHDGSEMGVLDAIDSIDRARNDENSQLKDLLSTIKEVRRVDADTLEIETYEPDPLLLSRLSTVYVVPQEWDEGGSVGTGAFMVSSYEVGEGKLVLERFEDYWGARPFYEKATYLTAFGRTQRVQSLTSDEADVLDYVPYDLVDQLGDQFEVRAIPSLEVQFLAFNFKSNLFKNPVVRKAVAKAIDRRAFAEFVGGEYAHEVGQFVSSGVFGYDPDIEGVEYDLDEAESLIKKEGLYGEKVVIVLPYGLGVFGEYLIEVLDEIGLVADLTYVKSEYLVDTLWKIDFDMYFLGFKSELGDSSDFLKSLAYTGAPNNFGRYSNSEVDELIEKQEVEMSAEDRLSYLQDAMEILVEYDVFGVPLFEYETLYAVRKGMPVDLRIDGFIFLQSL